MVVVVSECQSSTSSQFKVTRSSCDTRRGLVAARGRQSANGSKSSGRRVTLMIDNGAPAPHAAHGSDIQHGMSRVHTTDYGGGCEYVYAGWLWVCGVGGWNRGLVYGLVWAGGLVIGSIAPSEPRRRRGRGVVLLSAAMDAEKHGAGHSGAAARAARCSEAGEGRSGSQGVAPERPEKSLGDKKTCIPRNAVRTAARDSCT